MNMQLWLDAVIKEKIKKPMPLLSSPAAELMGVDVSDLARDGALQAKAMMLFSERYDSLAAVSMMDLSVEAEAFGARAVYSDGEVPTVTGALIRSRGDAEALPVPDMNSGRLGEYIKAIRLASEKITDRPIFAGIIGPFSLVGRLMDVSEAMICCYDDPETVEIMLEKASEFLIKYALGFKAAGASGIIMAEPLAGMLSPTLEEEFSMPYVKRIADAVQDESFILIYHNCGGNINLMCDSFSRNGAAAYHFGNSVKITDMLEKMPCDKVIMGNVDPAGIIKNGTPDDVRAAVTEIMESASEYSSFVLSSGCDIPPETKIENIDAFFLASREFYEKDITYKLRVLPIDREITAPHGEALTITLSRLGIFIPAACGGRGTCGKCRARLISGSIGGIETDGEGYFLSCKATVSGDAVIEISEQLYIDEDEKGDTLPIREGFLGAVDIGTTTVCAAITSIDGSTVYKRRSALNPEGIFGADVLSRIQAASEGKLFEMQSLICKKVNEMLLDMTGGASPERLFVTANTTMLHIFMGVDPSSIGAYPFEPEFLSSMTVKGETLGISAKEITLLPSASGYIGADVIGGAAALGMHKDKGTSLLVDVGTNGEIIIAHNGEYHALSAAAGPALEGASIECGTGAVKGSISSVEYKAGELRLGTVGKADPIGISGSGLIDLISVLVSDGIIDETGAFDYDSDSPLSAKLVEGRFYLTDKVYLSDADVRQFQLAKSAISASIETLLVTLGIGADEISDVYIAGGLGTYMNMENAARVGLLPRDLLKKARSVGNSALLGALLCCRSSEAISEMTSLSSQVKIVELSSSEVFRDKFMDNMYFKGE